MIEDRRRRRRRRGRRRRRRRRRSRRGTFSRRFKRINIERTEMIALSTHSGDGSPAVPVIGAMGAIGPQLEPWRSVVFVLM